MLESLAAIRIIFFRVSIKATRKWTLYTEADDAVVGRYLGLDKLTENILLGISELYI